MGNYFNQFWEKLKEIYSRLEPRQKIVLGALLIMTIAIFIWLVSWSTKEEYGLLFGNMELKEAKTAIDKLEEMGIKYKLENSGKSIYIPANQVYKTRIALSSDGVGSSSGLGFEVFDGSTLGMTEFIQNVNYQRAMEGELRRTIESIKGIEYARVHLVFPEEKLFKEDQKPPTASIMLNLKKQLNEKQIQGITNLVSSAIEGLEMNNINIVDQEGNVLTEHYDSDVAGLSNYQMKLQREVERTLTKKVQSMLNQTFGAENSTVTVAADLNFEKIHTTSEKYDPASKVVRSEEIETSSTNNQADSLEKSDEHLITNYEINRTVQEVTNQVGNIKRLTVSVLVNHKKETTETDGEITEEYVERSPAELAQIEASVRTAVGFNEERGDQINVNSVLFEDSIEAERQREREMEIAQQKQFYNLLERGGVLLALVIMVFALISQFRKIFVVKEEEEEVEPVRPSIAEGESESEGFNPEGEEGMPMGEGKIKYKFKPMKDIEIEQTEESELRKKVSKFIVENPETAARLIKSWILND